MKPDPLVMKNALKKREAELQKIIKQMKHDQLNSGHVFRNLTEELEAVKSQLTAPKN